MIDTLSVIITCYNLEKYIAQAIESVLNQDYQGKLEVVVIDDCSTDSSADVIKAYSNVRYIRPMSNLGVLMATVLGLESTTGQLVFFLDGDDVWEPSKLSSMVECFNSDLKPALVTHDLCYIDSDGCAIARKSRVEEVMGQVPSANYHSMTSDGILLHSDYVWLGSAYAIHRELSNIKEFCVFARSLPNPFNTYQDWPLAFWVACQPGVHLGYVPLKLFRYRLHGANHSGDSTSVSKAVRNFRRARNTVQAMYDLTRIFGTDGRIQAEIKRKLELYIYLNELYEGMKWMATKRFIAILPYLCSARNNFLGKELLRFLGIQILGVERFVGMVRLRK